MVNCCQHCLWRGVPGPEARWVTGMHHLDPSQKFKKTKQWWTGIHRGWGYTNRKAWVEELSSALAWGGSWTGPFSFHSWRNRHLEDYTQHRNCRGTGFVFIMLQISTELTSQPEKHPANVLPEDWEWEWNTKDSKPLRQYNPFQSRHYTANSHLIHHVGKKKIPYWETEQELSDNTAVILGMKKHFFFIF